LGIGVFNRNVVYELTRTKTRVSDLFAGAWLVWNIGCARDSV
jgi:hypothetical protein